MAYIRIRTRNPPKEKNPHRDYDFHGVYGNLIGWCWKRYDLGRGSDWRFLALNYSGKEWDKDYMKLDQCALHAQWIMIKEERELHGLHQDKNCQ